MTKVITYGTYDLFHEGHYRLLKRAKELGDYLIVGVTSETFDKNRGKLNVRDSLLQRIENVKKTGFADEIIIEEYPGQKIDDIKRYNVDIFTVGSDWVGHFDYLDEFCKVQYLERTPKISSTALRNKVIIRLGIIGSEYIVSRFCDEAKYVSGLEITSLYDSPTRINEAQKLADQLNLTLFTDEEKFLDDVDAVYVCSPPKEHYRYIKLALEKNKHVLCEFPFLFNSVQAKELFALAEAKSRVLFHGLKTAYCPAFQRLVTLTKTGIIGNILSVDANFTQVLGDKLPEQIRIASGGSLNALGEYPFLAFIKLLGTEFKDAQFFSRRAKDVDIYTHFYLRYEKALATATVAVNAKGEGDLVITGTKGYFYVPAPWWKTEYFEARFEDTNNNMKYFYKFQGEGLRYELADFLKSISSGQASLALTREETLEMVSLLESYNSNKNIVFF